jgi:protein-histidine pros-kinase
MGLRLKFNIVLIAVFAIGASLSALVSYELLQRNAKQEVLRNAGLMMEAALAMRGYTVTQVKPLLDPRLGETFLPQSVAAFAATEMFNSLRKTNPDFNYKEATLNPTNPRDRVLEWEADVVNAFRNQADLTEVAGERMTPTGPTLYLARPIQVKEPGCLACHSTPSAAPASMIKVYGDKNGFGWNYMDIVGAQVVSVPMSLPIRNANHVFVTFMASLGAILLVVFIVLNVMLSVMIIQPIANMSRAADKISIGNFNVPEFGKGKDEIAALGTSFNRMRRSLQKALKLIEVDATVRAAVPNNRDRR